VALARLGEVQPALNAIARSLVDRRPSLRAAGCNAASAVRDRVAARLVRKALVDQEPRVRLAAARALLTHGERKPAAESARSLRAQFCEAAALDQQLLCCQAAELLAATGAPAGLALLRELGARGATPRLRLQALTAALQRGGALQDGIGALSDEDPEIVLSAAAWLVIRTR